MLGNMRKRVAGKDAGFLPGMWKSGHRQYNHDIATAMTKGYQTAGPDGVYVAMAHLLQDTISDSMNSQVGPDFRDLFEASINIAFGKKKR